MRQITLTSLSGISTPFTVEVCDLFQYNCVFVGNFGVGTVAPPSIIIGLPSFFDTAPAILIKITDAKNCIIYKEFSCVEPVVPPLYPYCSTCGSVEGFISSATTDGYYADDTSPFLIYYSAGSILNAFEIEYTGSAPVAPVTNTGYRAYTNGKIFINYVSASTDHIAVYDPPGTLLTTFSLVTSGCGGIEYDSNSNKIFFTDNPPPFTDRRLGYFDPDTYAITYDVAANYGGGFAFPFSPDCNPITFEKYIRTGNYRYYVLSSGITPTLSLNATITGSSVTWTGSNQPRRMTFNSTTGDGWITSDFTGNTQEIVVVDPYVYSTTTVNQSCLSTDHYVYVNNSNQAITYYPGDGTVGSDKMFVIYANTGLTDYKIVQFDTSPPYNNSVFYTEATAGATTQNIFYSQIYNKIFYTVNSNINVFEPTDSTIDLCPTLTLPFSTARSPIEDTQNELIFYPTSTTSIYWLGLDEQNAIDCNEQIIDFYSGNTGPYKYNSITLSWDSMCTTNVTYNTPTPSRFTIDAQISQFSNSAYLSYSSTSVSNWTPIFNINGDVLISSSVWSGGTIFDNPDTSFILRVTFVSPSGCELYGPEI